MLPGCCATKPVTATGRAKKSRLKATARVFILVVSSMSNSNIGGGGTNRLCFCRFLYYKRLCYLYYSLSHFQSYNSRSMVNHAAFLFNRRIHDWLDDGDKDGQ